MQIKKLGLALLASQVWVLMTWSFVSRNLKALALSETTSLRKDESHDHRSPRGTGQKVEILELERVLRVTGNRKG